MSRDIGFPDLFLIVYCKELRLSKAFTSLISKDPSIPPFLQNRSSVYAKNPNDNKHSP